MKNYWGKIKALVIRIVGKFLDHIIETIVVAVIGITGSLAIWKKFSLVKIGLWRFMQWHRSGWIALVSVTVVFVCFRLYKLLSGSPEAWDGKVQKPPKYMASMEQGSVDREYAGVVWRMFLGTHVQPQEFTNLRREHVWVFVYPRPQCPACDYQLDRRTCRKWYCVPCRKWFAIPHDLRRDTWEKMRRIFERHVVQWGGSNFGIAEEPKRKRHS